MDSKQGVAPGGVLSMYIEERPALMGYKAKYRSTLSKLLLAWDATSTGTYSKPEEFFFFTKT